MYEKPKSQHKADDKCLGSPRELLFSAAATPAGIYLPGSKHWPALPLPTKALLLLFRIRKFNGVSRTTSAYQGKSDKPEGALQSFPPHLVWGLSSLEGLVKTKLNSAFYEDGRFSFNNCGSSHPKAVKSEKHKQHLEVTYLWDFNKHKKGT